MVTSIGMMDAAYFVGRTEILAWINSTLHLNQSKVEESRWSQRIRNLSALETFRDTVAAAITELKTHMAAPTQPIPNSQRTAVALANNAVASFPNGIYATYSSRVLPMALLSPSSEITFPANYLPIPIIQQKLPITFLNSTSRVFHTLLLYIPLHLNTPKLISNIVLKDTRLNILDLKQYQRRKSWINA
ncbi:hypothetical protein Syun_019243 [Stephania yunnanensis]|uniref:Uncharacterized protein n=1 Tax=Stephania yunnanensis TaxID=152371 RepID=A0AAP0ITS0_9MAGN